MQDTRSLYRTAPELVAAFLEQPLPKELYRLSRFEKVVPPWGPPPHGSGPAEYAAAWVAGYDGGPIRGAFRWLGQQGLDEALTFLPKTLRGRGRVPKRPLIEEFTELPEVERMIRNLLKHGAAMHDIQELLFAQREIWAELDRQRPDVWAAEELVEVLSVHQQRSRSMDAVPASFAFLWNSSDEPFHVRQLERSRRMLVRALQEVMPGTFG